MVYTTPNYHGICIHGNTMVFYHYTSYGMTLYAGDLTTTTTTKTKNVDNITKNSFINRAENQNKINIIKIIHVNTINNLCVNVQSAHESKQIVLNNLK